MDDNLRDSDWIGAAFGQAARNGRYAEEGFLAKEREFFASDVTAKDKEASSVLARSSKGIQSYCLCGNTPTFNIYIIFTVLRHIEKARFTQSVPTESPRR